MKYSKSRLLFFAAPAAPLAALSVPLNVYLPAYFARDLGMNLAVVGTVFLLARTFDVVIDPLIGALSDRTITPLGRRRPWMLASAPVIVASTALTFFQTTAPSAVGLLTCLFGLYLGYSMLAIPHLSWSAEFVDDTGGLLRVQAFIAGVTATGVVIGLGVPLVVRAMGFSAIPPIASVGAVIIVSTPLAILSAVASLPERLGQPARRSILQIIPEALACAIVRRILMADLAYSFAIGTIATLFIFYLEGVLGLRSGPTPLVLFYGSAILSSPVWIKLERRTGKLRLARLASLGAAFTTLNWLWLAQLQAPVAVVEILVLAQMTLLGFVAGNLYAVVRAWMAEYLTDNGLSEASAGSYFALLSITGKFGFALATGVALNGLALGGVDPGHIVGRSLVVFYLFFVGGPLAGYLTLAYALRGSREGPSLKSMPVEP